jgi:hypothetical protein
MAASTATSTTTTTTTQDLILWIGGSSCLARTFVNLYHGDSTKKLLLSGVEDSAPDWLSSFSSSSSSIRYVQCDLTKLTTEDAAKKILNDDEYGSVTKIIIGVRPILFGAYNDLEASRAMVQGIQTLLRSSCCDCDARSGQKNTVKFVLHISSVAAADHLRTQSFASEDDPIPPLSEYTAPYDLFKRNCEDVVSTICNNNNNDDDYGTINNSSIPYCHLRLSAIFSDDPKCIQCSALGLQARAGCYLPNPIDCNSSRNVARAIAAILERSGVDDDDDDVDDAKNKKSINSIRPLYYYTRPLQLKRPEPYGYYLETYRKAYGIEGFFAAVWIPVWVVTWFVAAFHWMAQQRNNSFLFGLPYVDSADYLLQVAAREHSFDCSHFARDFPDLEEESILECFVRRRAFLSGNTATTTKKLKTL